MTDTAAALPMTPRLPTSHAPHSLWQAMLRGIRGKCPRCQGTRLFARFLKPEPRCRACGQDWSLHSADDFPPYVAILISGHLLAPVIILLGHVADLPLWAMMATVVTLALALTLSLLQPAKGAIIALQWWFGLSGFAGAPGKAEAPEGAG